MNSPFNEEQVELLNRLLPQLTDGQQNWLSGYLAALQSASAGGVASVQGAPSEFGTPAVATVSKEVTVLYGSQTGTGQGLAGDLEKQLTEKGFEVTLSSMNDFKPKDLKKLQNLLIIVSTHGEGDPPDTALPLHEFINGKRAPQLEELNYSVLSLGDSSYEFFCQTGKDFDERLEALGGKQITPRVDCDFDFEELAEEWFKSVLSALDEAQAAGSVVAESVTTTAIGTDQSTYSRTNPYKAEVLENINLNGRGSNKENHHLELSLEGSGIEFEPGDSLGIFPENDSNLVDQLIEAADWNPEEQIVVHKDGTTLGLRDALITHYEITVLTKPLLQKIGDLTANANILALLDAGKEDELRDYIYGRDLLDLFYDHELAGVSASEFTALLRKIPGRLYSIASSLKANPDEVHLVIGTVRYELDDRARGGVCSVQCAERVEPGDTLSIYIQKNDNFRLPEDPNQPIILIGPGTGIAPFRSFIEEREELGAEGENWLFFGDQHYVTDFLYQTEWQRWFKDGILTKLDVAFSRDSEEKVYVQHRMLDNSKEFYSWLEKGAAVYVCGDEKHMAHDVHQTLLTIIQKEGSKTAEEAETYLTDLQQQKRYLRDVY